MKRKMVRTSLLILTSLTWEEFIVETQAEHQSLLNKVQKLHSICTVIKIVYMCSFFNILLTTLVTAAMVTENAQSEITEAGIVTGVVISAGIITFVTAAIMVTVCVVLKKKYVEIDRSEHTFESFHCQLKNHNLNLVYNKS